MDAEGLKRARDVRAQRRFLLADKYQGKIGENATYIPGLGLLNFDGCFFLIEHPSHPVAHIFVISFLMPTWLLIS